MIKTSNKKGASKGTRPENFGLRIYFFEFAGAMCSYFGTLAGVVASRPHETHPWIEVLPALPLLFVFWAIIRQYGRMDEFYKRIHAESFALGAMVMGLIYMVWGFAENAGAPALSTMWIAPGLLAAWGLCLPIVMKRY